MYSLKQNLQKQRKKRKVSVIPPIVLTVEATLHVGLSIILPILMNSYLL